MQFHHFHQLSDFLNRCLSTDTKVPLKPASEGKHHRYVSVDHFSKYIATALTSKRRLLTLWTQYFTSGFQNLIRLNIWLQIEELNKSTLNWQIGVPFLLFDTLQDVYMHLGQINLLKYKLKILERICECFYKILVKIGLFKNNSLLMLLLRNHCHICIYRKVI